MGMGFWSVLQHETHALRHAGSCFWARTAHLEHDRALTSATYAECVVCLFTLPLGLRLTVARQHGESRARGDRLIRVQCRPTQCHLTQSHTAPRFLQMRARLSLTSFPQIASAAREDKDRCQPVVKPGLVQSGGNMSAC